MSFWDLIFFNNILKTRNDKITDEFINSWGSRKIKKKEHAVGKYNNSNRYTSLKLLVPLSGRNASIKKIAMASSLTAY